MYKTIGFIHVTDTNFIDRFSYFATAKSQIFDEGRTKRKGIYKLSVGFCLLKLHPEFEELYEHSKVKPSSYATTKILLIVLSKMLFLNQLSSLKRVLNESNFDRSAAFQELPF